MYTVLILPTMSSISEWVSLGVKTSFFMNRISPLYALKGVNIEHISCAADTLIVIQIKFARKSFWKFCFSGQI